LREWVRHAARGPELSHAGAAPLRREPLRRN
jgi:hypothetical protein